MKIWLPANAMLFVLLLCGAGWFVPLGLAQAGETKIASDNGVSGRGIASASVWATESQPAISAFNAWVQTFLADSTVKRNAETASGARLRQGVLLAKQRRVALAGLMRTDPARALAASLPAAVRARLPARIQRQLETPFSTAGDYLVYGQLPAAGGPAVAPIRREVRIDGRTYQAHVYGRRFGMTCKQNIFLHGILLGDEAVLDESVLRLLPADEAATETRVPKDLLAAAESSVNAGPVLAEAGGTLYRFASEASLRQSEASLRALESRHTPETTDASEPQALEDPASIPTTPESAYTTGNKNVLIIRVDFSDLAAEPPSLADVQAVADGQVKPYYARSSYGLTSLTNTVTPKVYRMPHTAAYYSADFANEAFHADARAAASVDYPVDSYDRIIVLFPNLSAVGPTGMAELGGKNVWVNGEFDFRVVAHELGHTYGLGHANLWQVNDGNPASATGTSSEYGDEFDTMGGNPNNNQETDFNPWFKSRLDWISPDQVQTVTTDGVYRVKRIDGAAGGVVALKIARDSESDYWIGVRRNFASNPTMSHGLYIGWGFIHYTFNLLDTQTPGTDASDAALPTGSIFYDEAARISIQPLAEGGTASNEYEDVQIRFNVAVPAPAITSALAAEGKVGEAFTYRITTFPAATSFDATGLPPGLTIDASTGAITGAPTAAGTFPIMLSAANAGGTGTATLTLMVQAARQLTVNAHPANGGTVSGSGVYPAETEAEVSASAAAGWKIDSITVVPAGSDLELIQKMFLLQQLSTGGVVTSISGSVYTDQSKTVTFNFASLTLPTITSPDAAAAQEDAPFSYQITAANDPTGFGVAGLPDGLMVNGASGVISGTPKQSGTFTVALTATNANGSSNATLTLNISATPPVITSPLSARGQIGQTFSYQITASHSPTSYKASNLPDWLNINTEAGLIFGTPPQLGSFNVTIGAANSGGETTATLAITITPDWPVATLAATTPVVEAGSGARGVFTLRLSSAQDHDVVVKYTIKGSAVNGADYVLLTGTKKIKAGKTSKPVKIIPLGDLGGSNKTVKLVLEPGDGYTVGTSGKVKVKLLAH